MAVTFNPNNVYMGHVVGDLLNQELGAPGEVKTWYTVERRCLDKENDSRGFVHRLWITTERALFKVVIKR